jgi:hypothetical protein
MSSYAKKPIIRKPAQDFDPNEALAEIDDPYAFIPAEEEGALPFEEANVAVQSSGGFDPAAALAEIEGSQSPLLVEEDPLLKLSSQGPQEERPGLLSRAGSAALSGLGYAGEKLAAYGGLNSALKAIETAQDTGVHPGKMLSNAWKAYGEPTVPLASGKGIAEKAGLSTETGSEINPHLYSEDPWADLLEHGKLKRTKGGLLDFSLAGAAGLLLEMGIDPTSLAAKGALKLGKTVVPPVAKGAKDFFITPKATDINIPVKEVPPAAAAAAAPIRAEGGLLSPELKKAHEAGILRYPETSADDVFTGPKSLDELEKFSEANPIPGRSELTVDRLRSLDKFLSKIGFKRRPLLYHYDKASSGARAAELEAAENIAGTKSSPIATYNEEIRSEISRNLDDDVRIGSNFNPNKDQSIPFFKTKVQAGSSIVSEVVDNVKKLKEKLAPKFNALAGIHMNTPMHKAKIISAIDSAFPELGKYIGVSQEGGKITLSLPRYTPTMGLTKEEYTKIVPSILALNNEMLTFKGIQNIRTNLLKSLKQSNKDLKQFPAIQRFRKALLSSMEDLANNPVETAVDGLTRKPRKIKANIKEIFQSWAKGEQAIDDLVEMLDGEIQGLEFNEIGNISKVDMNSVVPETILQRAFQNTNRVEILKNMIADKLLSASTLDGASNALMKDILESSFHQGTQVYSFPKIRNAIKQKREVLLKALGPERLDKIENLVEYGLVVPDKAINTSATSKITEAMNRIKERSINLLAKGLRLASRGGKSMGLAVFDDWVKFAETSDQQEMAVQMLNEALGTKSVAERSAILDNITDTAKRLKARNTLAAITAIRLNEKEKKETEKKGLLK